MRFQGFLNEQNRAAARARREDFLKVAANPAETPEERKRAALAARRESAWLDEPEVVVVTRHPALVELLRERGLAGDDALVLDHATPDDVLNRRVIGVLPLHLAALTYEVVEVPLALTAEMRGRELTLDELRAVAGEAVTYNVTRCQVWPRGSND